MEQHVGTARKGSLALALIRPGVVAGNQLVQPLNHRFATEPRGHRSGSKLDQDALTSVLHRREPCRLQGNRGALDFSVVLAVHVRHDRFQPCEPGERQHLPQPVNLNDRFDGVESCRVAPDRFRQPASVKVRIDGSVVTVTFRDRQQGIQLRMLDGTIPGRSAGAPGGDGVEHLLVGE